MLDDPRGVDILESVSRLMREQMIPKLPPDAVFHARVAANAVDLVVPVIAKHAATIDAQRFMAALKRLSDVMAA